MKLGKVPRERANSQAFPRGLYSTPIAAISAQRGVSNAVVLDGTALSVGSI
jgi:hypothetical protein